MTPTPPKGEWNICFHEATQDELDRLGMADVANIHDGACVITLDSHTMNARTIAVCNEYGTAHVVESSDAKHTDLIEEALEKAMALYAELKWGKGATQ